MTCWKTWKTASEHCARGAGHERRPVLHHSDQRSMSRTYYRIRNQAKADAFDSIECFYNPKRRHSTLGYLSPVADEKLQKT